LGGFGFSTAWTGQSGLVTNNSIVRAGSFTYTDSFGNSISSSGNRAYVTGDGAADGLPGGYTGSSSASPFRRFAFTRGTGAAAETTWVSLIATRVGPQFAYTNSIGAVSYYPRGVGAFQMFYNATAGSTTQGNEMFGIGRGSENSSTQATNLTHTMDSWALLNRGDANQQVTSDVGFASLPADFLLLRIDHVPGTDPRVSGAADVAYLWINPQNLAKEPSIAKADLTFSSSTVAANGTANDRDYVFNTLRLFGGNTNATAGYSAIELDEIRVGTDYFSVTLLPIPEPTVFAFGALAGLALLAIRKLNQQP
jgi:hypothetical protein